MASRSRIEHELELRPGQHLVIVRYSEKHSPHEEWIYNKADIDGAKIVWAREIPGMSLKSLVNYFRKREVWLAEPDASPARLTPLADLESIKSVVPPAASEAGHK
jgi:hypothetical protein